MLIPAEKTQQIKKGNPNLACCSLAAANSALTYIPTFFLTVTQRGHRGYRRGPHSLLTCQTLRFRICMCSASLLPHLWRTPTLVAAAAIDQSDMRARSLSLPFFLYLSSPLWLIFVCAGWWEAEIFGPLVCS